MNSTRSDPRAASGDGAPTAGQDQLAASDRRCLWHPFTQMALWAEEDITVIARAEGRYLFDREGNKFLDAVSSLWCNVHGHRVPAIDRAVEAQLAKVAHSTFLGLSHEPGIALGERLVRVAPAGLSRVFYSDSGAAAVEVALKMAFQYFQITEGPETARTRFAYFSEGYHGDTLGAVAVGGIEAFHALYRPLLPDHLEVDLRGWHRRRPGDEEQAREAALAMLERTISRHADTLAAAIIEPAMQGAGGMLTLPNGYLRRLRELCDAHGLLLICDEVATGFGRTGTMFACEHETVSPDLMAVGKGLTGGYLPLSATLASERIYEAFLGSVEERKTFFHGHTYTANPLACAAAIASLDLFEQEDVLANVRERAAQLSAWLRRIERRPHVRECRAVGLMAGIELAPTPLDRSSAYPAGDRTGHRVALEARRRGIMLRPLGDTLVLMPPLTITEAEVDRLCEVVAEAIEVVTEAEERFGAGPRGA